LIIPARAGSPGPRERGQGLPGQAEASTKELAADYRTVEREPLPRLDQHRLAHQHRFGLDFSETAVQLQMGQGRLNRQ